MTTTEALRIAREALNMLRNKWTPQVNGADETCFIVGMRNQITWAEAMTVADAIREADAALSAIDAAPSVEPVAQHDQWNRAGRDPVKFHPQASHISPDYRDGWNAALNAVASATPPAQPAQAPMSPWIQRQKPFTDSQIDAVLRAAGLHEPLETLVDREIARAIERAHGITPQEGVTLPAQPIAFAVQAQDAKDAGRYRGLRSAGHLDRIVGGIHPCDESRRVELTDAAVDRAIGAAAQGGEHV